VAGAVKGKSIVDAIEQLAVMQRRSSLVVLKVMRQVLANAQHNHGLTVEQLMLKNIIVDEGQTYKRFRAVSRGRAHTILKRTCHITVQLETQTNKETQEKVTKAEAPVKATKKVETKAEDSKADVLVKTDSKKTTKKTVTKKTSISKTKKQKS
jgi:large subunit ribosomal protein L22